MKDRPILFSAPMVRALIDGRKTMTRRVVKPTIMGCTVGTYSDCQRGVYECVNVGDDGDPIDAQPIACPYGAPGHRLWVRETWMPNGPGVIHYRADIQQDMDSGLRWRPSIYMPRSASRLTLEITAVRVERVQQITDEDAVREGIVEGLHGFYVPGIGEDHPGQCFVGPRYAFGNGWDKLHGPGAWDRNEWVWAIEFKVIAAMRDRA